MMKRNIPAIILTVVVQNCLSSLLPTKTGCNPMVDILFVLDGSSYVNETEFLLQKAFISELLDNRQAPKGAVRVSVSVCSGTNVSSVPFTDSANKLINSLNNMSDTKEQNCLEGVNFKFKSESREGISRIVVLLRGGGKWNDAYTREQGLVAKKEKIVVVMVAVGIRDFETLSSLQSLASEDGTFFVLSRYSDLRMLASSLSKDSCKPISLEISPENNIQTVTTSQLGNDQESCIPLDSSSYKRHVPGFGYTREKCTLGQTLDIKSCSCM